MKKVLLALFYLFLGSKLWASESCKLNEPIDLDGIDLFDQDLILEKAVVDKVPIFSRPENYDPQVDTLNVRIGNLNVNDTFIDMLGIGIRVSGANERVGLGGNYNGSFNFRGRILEENGKTVYTTKLTSQYSDPQHAEVDAVTLVKISVDGDKLVSLELTFPVFRVQRAEGGVDYLAFTGEHQTVCVLAGTRG